MIEMFKVCMEGEVVGRGGESESVLAKIYQVLNFGDALMYYYFIFFLIYAQSLLHILYTVYSSHLVQRFG